MNQLPSAGIVLLLLLCVINGLQVRITDRKPKWVIEEERRLETLKAERAFKQDHPESDSQNPSDDAAPSMNQDDDSDIPRRRSPEPFSGPEVMLPLSTVCETFTSSQYRYTICPYQYVNQIEVSGGNYRGCIGIWKEYSESPISNSEIRLSMTDGENCFTGTDRETELIISCDDSLDKMLSVSAVNEVRTCHYVVEAASPLVCKIPVPEEPVSMPVDMGDEVGVRRPEEGIEQVVQEDTATVDEGVAVPNDDRTPSEHIAPPDSPVSQTPESPVSQTPDNPEPKDSQPEADALQHRTHCYHVQL